MNVSEKTEIKLKKVCSVVLKLDPEAAYCSILDCPDGKIRLYYRGKGRSKETHVCESNDGITFSPPRVILRKSFICHNFSPFIHEGKLYAIGGKAINYKLKKKHKVKKKHGDGLYLLYSENGLSWRLVQESPIITLSHPGFIRAPFNLKGEIDSPISCIYYQKKFYLYFRANIEKGVRAIQYAVSDNLLDWSEIRLVQFNPAFDVNQKYNFYGPYFFDFEGKIKGMIPCFLKDGKGFIGLFDPDDGLGVWYFKGWFNKAPVFAPEQRKFFFPVKGIIRNRHNPDILHYYVHSNYLKRKADQPVTIDLYIHENHLQFGTLKKLVLKYPALVRLSLLGGLLRVMSKFKYRVSTVFKTR